MTRGLEAPGPAATAATAQRAQEATETTAVAAMAHHAGDREMGVVAMEEEVTGRIPGIPGGIQASSTLSP